MMRKISFHFVTVCGYLIAWGTFAYSFDIDYEYHYEYKANSVVLGKFPVVTIAKFRIQPLMQSNGSIICHLHMTSLTQSAGGKTVSNPVGWNFKRGFEFELSEDGLIKEVAHHNEEHHDVINFKKVLASVFSAIRKPRTSTRKTFNNWEQDHSGYLQHRYEVQNTTMGYKVDKFHESEGKVYRKHRKTLHYTNTGVIEYIRADDKVIIQNKNKQKKQERRYSVFGARAIEEETSGDVSDIESNTKTEVRLVNKIKIHGMNRVLPLATELKVKDSIAAKKGKSQVYLKYDEVQEVINSKVACIELSKNTVNEKRTNCFVELLETVNRLHKDEYKKLASRELSQHCWSNNTMCISRRNVFIDLLLVKGENITQDLTIQHFLQNKDVNETDLFRIFFHIGKIEAPTLEFLEAVERLCLEPYHSKIRYTAMTKNQKHACLALGTLIKTCRNNSLHIEKTDILLNSLKQWLTLHNQTHYTELQSKKRPHRSVDRNDRELHNYTYSKMVLIHALGNTGSSRDHLLTYMRPGEGDNSWRRAAILAMRHFGCVESSTALFNLVVNDDHSVVKQQALEMFENHPLSNKSIPEHRDIILSRSYNYKTLMRTKRGVLDVDLKDGFFFSLKLPGIQWTKQVGNEALGAAFGISLTNELEIEIKPLSSHAMINMYENAFAKVMLGWFNVEQYLFRAHACYRGHAGYDINILKDFGINGTQDLAMIFDRIVKTVIDPVLSKVKAFKTLIQSYDNKGIEYIVNKIIDVIRNVPLILKDLIQKAVDAVMKVVEYGGTPWIDQIKKIVTKIRYFVEDVKEDITNFYSTIVDAVTVTLPYVGKNLFDSVAAIISALKDFLTNPVQSVTIFGKSVLDIKLALGIFIDVKNKMIETLSYLKGGTSFWIDYWEDFKEILGDIQDLFRLIFKRRENIPAINKKDKLSTALTDGIQMTTEQTNMIIDSIQKSFGNFSTEFKETFDELLSPFVNSFYSMFNAVKAVKSGYTSIRNTYIKIKNVTQKIFGSKFHITFPNHRRRQDSTCGLGVWPTNQNERYQTLGVDVQVTEFSDIRCPVNGEVFKESNRVLILPTDEDFIDYEIIIENIIPESNISTSGQFLIAGKDIIGKADKSPCKRNCIHVSVRKKSPIQIRDSDYEYIDPSPFLDHLLPSPRWIWDCRDYTYMNVLNVVSADATGEVLEKVNKEIVRSNFGEDKMNGFPPIEPKYRPPDLEVANRSDLFAVTALEKFTNGFKSIVSQFTDIAKQLFDFSNNRTASNLLDAVNINKYPLGKIKELLGEKVDSEMNIIFDKLQRIRSSVSAQNLDGLSMLKLQSLLSSSYSSASGAKSKMITRMLSRTEQECPSFLNTLPKGPGNLCFVHQSCNKISCAVQLLYANQRTMATFDIKMDNCLKQINVSTQSTTTVLEFQNADEIKERVRLADLSTMMTADLVVSVSILWSNPVISLSAELCVPAYISCLNTIPIMVNYELEETDCFTDDTDAVLPSMNDITVEDVIAELSNYNLLDREILKVLDTIREAMIKELISDPRTVLKVMGEEFKSTVDFCVEADIPFPVKDFVAVDSDSYPPLFIMVGPVPISIEFRIAASLGLKIDIGLCILSFKAQATLNPWAGAKAQGSVNVNYFVFKAGLRLTGYLLESQFPMKVEITYNKFPLEVKGSLNVSLIPLRLKLEAFCTLDFFGMRKTIFRGTLWTYSLKPITGNIFTNIKNEKDTTPPQFFSPVVNVRGNRQKRETVVNCLIKQITGRNHKDPAYELQVAADDDKSNLKLFYAIGTQQGGTNVLDFTEMGGFSVFVATNDLPNGIPLYWTVKAVNSQGSDARVYCMLHTFDNTLPDGRVDPSYKYSSHPNVLLGTITVFDDSLLKHTHMQAVGISSGMYGSEIISWKNLTLGITSHRAGVFNALKHFSIPKDGRLTNKPFAIHLTHTPEECATKCVTVGTKCVSFDYAYFTESCELQHVIEGPNAKLRISGSYKNYERLGLQYNSFERYEDIPLEHGKVYFINARIGNILGYVGYLHSVGTMVDFTPPMTGALGTDFRETFKADGCKASTAQRCAEVTWKKNHRHVIDGKEASTVINGHNPLVDKMYTKSNHYISVNFNGFHDDESGIYKYLWAVGKSVCSQDVVNFSDPHGFLHSDKHWTNNGIEKNLHLQDGKYFNTIQCLNSVVFGGSLVTTVCHSLPLIVDTTPPFLHGIEQIYYDEYFDILAIYYKAGDNESMLADVEFGLGKTKYDVLLMKKSYHQPMNGEDHPFIVIEGLGLKEGVPAWPRIRVNNGVGLFKADSGSKPFIIDRSPPIVGFVIDGKIHFRDITYQSSNKEICVQWTGFHDPESGIDHVRWGIGTDPGADNVMVFRTFSHNTIFACVSTVLKHNTKYYSTLVVFNAALNSKHSNSSSNGVLVDTTPPIPGYAVDGSNLKKDLVFSSKTATKTVSWNNFTDPESGIDNYVVSIYINNARVKTFNATNHTHLTDNSVSMQHGDTVHFRIESFNKAGLAVAVKTDGFTVDHTPPNLVFIEDNNLRLSYQIDDSSLTLRWQYQDKESGIKEYRYSVFELMHGIKKRVWPKTSMYISIPQSLTSQPTEIYYTEKLVSGATYSVHVTAINQAQLSTAHESNGVTIDPTPPIMLKVYLGLSDEDEEIEDGFVQYANSKSLRVSWVGEDPQSNIKKFFVAIGTRQGDTRVTNGYIDMGIETSADINVQLLSFDKYGLIYHVAVKAENGAGILSNPMFSKPIKIVKENVPGVIFDGREQNVDKDSTNDKFSIGMHFQGFESEACNIIGYEWAIGSQPYHSDIYQYSKYGLVYNETHGKAQTHVQLDENKTYYVTVKAKTGHNCHEEYIVSTSDGITTDFSPPMISNILPSHNEGTFFDSNSQNIYQAYLDSFEYRWNVSDLSLLRYINFSVGTLPLKHDKLPLRPSLKSKIEPGVFLPRAGESLFVTVHAMDVVEFSATGISVPIVADISPPFIQVFSCTNVISTKLSVVKCSWIHKEEESALKQVIISIGSRELSDDIIRNTTLPSNINTYSVDVKNSFKLEHLSVIYATLTVKNVLNQSLTETFQIDIDSSAPIIENVTFVTWINPDKQRVKQICQQPQTYVDVSISVLEDKESGLDRAEICLGSKPGLNDIKDYQDLTETHVTIDGISLLPGTQIYATVRAFNKVGLHNVLTSEAIQISLSFDPIIKVLDGTGGKDLDYQNNRHVIQGTFSYVYSGDCPVIRSEWCVEDLTGNIVLNFTEIQWNDHFFYNDELDLKNNFCYFVIVRLTDALNRTYIGKSDGITVKIQLPTFGFVRDGLDHNDIDYQESTTDLSANWDSFGDELSNDHSQQIAYYEISIGEETKTTSVYNFTNVGLNKSYTFTDVNLTSKNVLYFVIVRGYSKTGEYAESYSNGVRVGYRLSIIPGSIEVNEFQRSESEITLSWTDYQSDIGINEYIVGIYTKQVTRNNNTYSCYDFQNGFVMFDVYMLKVGLDTFVTLKNLTLHHGILYYITVIARDEIGQCSSSESKLILIDTTPPINSNITFMINQWNVSGLKQFFVTDANEIEIHLFELEDPESGIDIITFRLNEYVDCPTSEKQSSFILKEVKALKDPKVRMKSLELQPHRYYYIDVTASNNAGLQSQFSSPVMLLDTSSPSVGSTKIGNDWAHEKLYQSSTSTIEALTAIAKTEDAYLCDNTRTIFPSRDEFAWTSLSGDFSPSNVRRYKDKYILKIGYNVPLTKIQKSGIRRSIGAPYDGTISIVLSSAEGKNISTSVMISASKENPFFPKTFIRSNPTYFDDVAFNISEFENGNANDPNLLNTTDDPSIAETISPPISAAVNKTGPIYESINKDVSHGFGFQILGDQQQESDKWDCLFWAKDAYGEIHRWVDIKTNPVDSQLQYSIKMKKRNSNDKIVLDLQFSIDGEEKANIYGLTTDEGNLTIFVQTWNFNDYREPLKDPIHPFRSQAILFKLKIPSNNTMDCIYGAGFYDKESGISEIWAGVSDNVNTPGNIHEMTLYRKMCTPCMFNCYFSCDANCSFDDNKVNEFEMLQINIQNLNLMPTVLSNDGLNSTMQTEILSILQYYVNVKMINFAGQSVTSSTNPVIIDITPPVCEYIQCLDPVFTGMETPTQTLGSNKTIGAYWSCIDNISGIKNIYVKVGTEKEKGSKMDDDKYEQKEIGHVSKVRIDLDDNIYFDDRTTYFVNILVYNGAGLSAVYSCNVSTILSPPDVSTTDSQIMHSLEFDNQTGVVFMGSLDRFGVKWNTKRYIYDAELYKWQMGTYKDGADIIPKTIIGLTKEGSAQVIGGELWLNGNKTGKSIASLSQNIWRNLTNKEIIKTESDFQFFMEPGRCVYLSLIAVGYSHLEANISTNQLCFIRKDKDLVIHKHSKISTIIGWISDDKFEELQHVNGNEIVVIQLRGYVLGVTVGTLSDFDLTTEYGSASSYRFRKYIINPHTTSWSSTREIRKRILKPIGINFFIAPTPEMDVERIEVHIKINPQDFEYNTVPALLIWDSYTFNSKTKTYGIWRHVEENCGEDITKPKIEGTIYKAKICMHVFQMPSRKKRSTIIKLIIPYQFTLTAMNVSYYNSPPVIDIETIVTKEDTPIINFRIPYHDDDLDSVQFFLIQKPKTGFANLSLDGKLTYLPKQDFFGNESITIQLRDDARLPAVIEKSIIISVTAVNDMPVFGFLYNSTTFDVMANKSLELRFEGNATSHYMFDFGFGDVDQNETLSFLSTVTNPNEVNVKIIRNSALPFIPDLFGKKDLFTHQEYSAEMVLDKDFHGDFFFYILGYDNQNFYTERLETHIYILLAPCDHGICSPKFNDSPPCNDISRATSFDLYKCICYPGYTGTWCENEINECLQQPCRVLENCIDQINNYKCEMKIVALIGMILFGFILFIILIIAICINIRMKQKIPAGEENIEVADFSDGEIDQ